MATIRRLLDYAAVAEVMEGAEAARLAANAATAKADDVIKRLSSQSKLIDDLLARGEQERENLSQLAHNLGASGLFVVGVEGKTAYLRTATSSQVIEKTVKFDNLGITLDVAEIPFPDNVMVGLQGQSSAATIQDVKLTFTEAGSKTLTLPSAGQIRKVTISSMASWAVYQSQDDLDKDSGRLLFNPYDPPTEGVVPLLEQHEQKSGTTQAFFKAVSGVAQAYVYCNAPAELVFTLEEA